MDPDLLERIHGHAGVLALAILVHPAILLWRGRPLSRGGRWAIGASMGLVALAFALGIAIYEDYRALVKADLFRASVEAGMRFETKEHLAWAVLSATLGAGATALLAPPDAVQLRRIAARIFLGAAILCAAVVVLGVHVAAIHDFP